MSQRICSRCIVVCATEHLPLVLCRVMLRFHSPESQDCQGGRRGRDWSAAPWDFWLYHTLRLCCRRSYRLVCYLLDYPLRTVLPGFAWLLGLVFVT